MAIAPKGLTWEESNNIAELKGGRLATLGEVRYFMKQ